MIARRPSGRPASVVTPAILIVLLLLLAANVDAQKTRALARIGFLTPTDSGSAEPAFRRGMQELGYVEGQNLVIESRSAHGQFDQLPRLASELAQRDVDVVVAVFTQASIAAKQATRKIPVVMIGVADPVGAGLAASLSRPAGNLTGTSSIASDIVGKQLEVISEIVRPLTKVAVLWNPSNSIYQTSQRREVENAGRSLGMRVRFVEVRTGSELERTFVAISNDATEAVVVLADPVLAQNHRRIAEEAVRRRMPSVGSAGAYAEVGGLVGYGPSYSELSRRAAYFVDRILKGAKPADLPI